MNVRKLAFQAAPSLVLGAALAASGLAGAGCNKKVDFKEGMVFAGTKDEGESGHPVEAHTLTAGYEAYMLYCYACHGEKGDGKGPASAGLRPPPRDFTAGIFKFGRMRAGDELPSDDDFKRIIQGGLHGTAMLPWDIPDVELNDVVQYIKTFSERWTKRRKNNDFTNHVVPEFEPSDDPWAGKDAEAIERGKQLYHLRAECATCHPAYGTRQELYEMSVAAAKKDPSSKPLSGFREDMYGSLIKEVKEYNTKILPPDFISVPVRSIRVKTAERPESKPLPHVSREWVDDRTELVDVYRVISYGVYPVMPAWKGALKEEEIWAISHYVKSLVDLHNTPEGRALRNKLTTQAAFAIPAPEPAPTAEPTAAASAEPSAAPDAGAPKDKKDDKKK